MLYLLDADVLIKADNTYYPRKRFPIFWDWLLHNGAANNIKIPAEQYDEIIAGTGELVDWLHAKEIKDALLLNEEANPDLVSQVTSEGYAPDLDETEVLKVGSDPFLISYGFTDTKNRNVVTFEVSAPSKIRANRKVPDVCAQFGVGCGNLFQLIEVLDFTTDWKP